VGHEHEEVIFFLHKDDYTSPVIKSLTIAEAEEEGPVGQRLTPARSQNAEERKKLLSCRKGEHLGAYLHLVDVEPSH